MKRPKQTLARLAHPDASSTLTSAQLAPAPLGTTSTLTTYADTGSSRTAPPDRPRPIGMHPGPSLTEPSSCRGSVFPYSKGKGKGKDQKGWPNQIATI